MFKFNFEAESDDQAQVFDCKNVVEWTPAKEIYKADRHFPGASNVELEERTFEYRGFKIYYNTAPLEKLGKLENNDLIRQLESEHSDLLVGKYEGGFKIWECTYDLMQFMIENLETRFKFDNARVLDLGCGAGILGLFSMLNGANVHFQDYNADVLDMVTIPNVNLNLDKCGKDVKENQRFFYGDWASYTSLIVNEIGGRNEEKFDYILTSETIYNTDNYEKLYNLIRNLLKETGAVYLSAKSHYFGIGGGISQFVGFITREGYLKSEVVWENERGFKRSVIRITHSTNVC